MNIVLISFTLAFIIMIWLLFFADKTKEYTIVLFFILLILFITPCTIDLITDKHSKIEKELNRQFDRCIDNGLSSELCQIEREYMEKSHRTSCPTKNEIGIGIITLIIKLLISSFIKLFKKE